jgi:hypothetical protein
MCEGNFRDSIKFISDRLDPNTMFRIMVQLVKRLYIKTKWNTEDKVTGWEKKLRKTGQLKDHQHKKEHYTKQEFGMKMDNPGGRESIVVHNLTEENTVLGTEVGRSMTYQMHVGPTQQNSIEVGGLPLPNHLRNQERCPSRSSRSIAISKRLIEEIIRKGDPKKTPKDQDKLKMRTVGD